MGDGSLKALPGGVDQYLDERVRRSAAAPVAAKPKGDTRLAKKELARLEREIARHEKREAELHRLLEEAATDYAKVAELDEELRAVVLAREAAEESWLSLSEEP
jgi:ATP-binding cassette subfamily F protein uup